MYVVQKDCLLLSLDINVLKGLKVTILQQKVKASVSHGVKNTLNFLSSIVATDHELLFGILNDGDLSTIDNSKIAKLKEKTRIFSLKLNIGQENGSGRSWKLEEALSCNPEKESC